MSKDAMDVEKVQELIKTIEESLSAFRYISLQLRSRRAMLPTLAPWIDENEKKPGQAIEALNALKDELGL